MWNPFSKPMSDSSGDVQPQLPADEGEVVAVDGWGTHNEIAEIAMMGSVAVATFSVSELTMDQGVEQLADLLQDLKESGAKHYVLDIQNIQYMDSMCLGCLVESLNSMAKTGGRIAIANGEQNVQQLFRMTRLDRVFPICRDVMSAITAVERQRA